MSYRCSLRGKQMGGWISGRTNLNLKDQQARQAPLPEGLSSFTATLGPCLANHFDFAVLDGKLPDQSNHVCLELRTQTCIRPQTNPRILD